MRKLILFLSLILSVGFASAQSEVPSDSIRRAPSSNIKEFGGFLLDMGLMNVATALNRKYLLYTGVMLTSLCENNPCHIAVSYTHLRAHET